MKVGDDSFGNLVETTWKSLAGPKETPQYIPEAYKLIGKLVVELPRHQQKIRSLTPVNRRPLVVSTNRDLMLERALLLNGVPFTRVVVVQSYINPNGSPVVRFVVNQYGASVREGMLTLAGWPAPIDVKAQNFTELDDAIFRCQWSEVGTVEEVNQILGDISGPLILYKCFGSYDHPGGCAIAIEHYEALSNEIVPRDIIRKVQTKPLLLLGYSCTDPEWRYLRRTLLRSLPPGVDARYVVQYPLPDGEQEVNFEIERALEDRAGALWQRANISNYLIAHGDTVLTEIIRQLPNAGR
jgi:hypothetical protein